MRRLKTSYWHIALGSTLLLGTAIADNSVSFSLPESILWSEPRELYNCVKRRKDEEKYVVPDKINPFYLRVDLNGDKQTEIAVLIERVRDKKLGIFICHPNGVSKILFAGVPIDDIGGKPSDDLRLGGMEFWRVYTGRIVRFAETPRPPHKAGEAIEFGKSESWSKGLYWTGKKYVTYQLGD